MRPIVAALALGFCATSYGEHRQRYIVELSSPPAAALADGAVFNAKAGKVARHVETLENEQRQLLSRFSAATKRPIEPLHRYRYVLNGFAVELTSEEANLWAQSPGVLRVTPDGVETLHTDAGPAWIGAAEAWAGVPNATGTRGEGVVVGVIDSGINAAHPAFAEVDSTGYRHQNPRAQRYGLCNTSAASRCNNKLIGIHDFTTEGARDGSDVNGHGTHVAGTAVGNVRSNTLSGQTASLSLTLSGVAPRANLISYKACSDDGASGTCPNSATVAALDQAVADGVDVVNYSIGGSAFDPWPGLSGGSTASIRAMANAARAGIAIAVSAGNDGPSPATISSPANSPWVLAAAAATSNRRIANVLTDLSGSVAAPAARFIGAGLAGGVGPVRIVLGESVGSARCSQGDGLDSPPTGASNPWAGQVFSGEIVVCDRGVQARVAKGFNVQRAGGGGMVLVNTAAEGDSIVSDDHFLPATHLGFRDGEALKNWVRASQGTARGRLAGVSAVLDDSFGDVLASFSSRGPDPNLTGILKPNISGPGVSIQAPAHNSAGERTLSGTSMSSPHMAGALALLKSRRQGLLAGELFSALQLTAAPGSRIQDGTTPATALDVGAGRARVDRALSAGLVMPITLADFERENPRSGGDPSRLNLPNLYRDSCRARCTFTRTFRALRAATYTVQDASTGVVVSASPASFSLSAGQTQSVQFVVDVSAPGVLGRIAHGLVLIRASDTTIPDSRLPVVMRSLAGDVPSSISISADADRGRFDANIANMVAVGQLSYRLFGPIEPRRERPSVIADSTPNDAYDNNNGTATFLVDLSAVGSIRADVVSSSANDIDLFVGRDENNDGAAAPGEERCQGIGSGPIERCTLNDQPPGRYWVRIQNANGSAAGNEVELEMAALPYEDPNRRGHAQGTTRIAEGGALPVAIHYDLNGLFIGQRAFGILEMRAGSSANEAFARVPLTFLRTGAAEQGARFLADGVTYGFLLAPGSQHDRLVIDVPQGASRLLVEQRGAIGNASLYLARANTTGGPDVPAAPGVGEAIVVVDSADSNETLALEAPQLTPGRYYVVPRNAGVGAAPVSLTARLTTAPLPPFAAEIYYNPARDGHGVLFTRAGSAVQMVWYTYDSDGQSTWYLAFPDGLAEGRGHVRADLYRYHWLGNVADGQRVGEVVLVRQNDRLMLNWEIDGRSGGEPLQLLASSACVQSAGQDVDPTGLWFEPARSGYGANFFTRPGTDFGVLYLYDGNGRPRWLLGTQNAFNSAPLNLQQYTGFCPSCAAVAVSNRNVGQFARVFDAPAANLTGRWSFSADFQAPLSGQFSANNVAVQLLTARKPCGG